MVSNRLRTSVQVRPLASLDHHPLLEIGSPQVWVLALDPVDQVDAEVEVSRFVAQDVLELLAYASH